MLMVIISLESIDFMNQFEQHFVEHTKVRHIFLSFFFSHSLSLGGGYYTLRDVIFFLENANLQISEYRAKVNAAGVTAVVVLDSPNLMSYLTGQIETCDQIDLNVMNSGTMEQIPGGGHNSVTEAQLSEGTMKSERMKFVQYLDQFVEQTNSMITTMSLLLLLAHPPRSSSSPRRSSDPTPKITLNSDFVKVDQNQLAASRADELPATNRAMVLIKPGSVTSPPLAPLMVMKDFGFALQSFHDHVLKDLVASSTANASTTPATAIATPNKASSAPPSVSTPGSSSSSSSHKRPLDATSSSRTPPSSSHSHKLMKSSHQTSIPNDGMNGVAIILVPAVVTSILCGLNSLDFLRDGKYVSVEEKRALGARREAEMRFEHFTNSGGGGGRRLLVRVLDTGVKLTDAEWSRVVAVFVQGQEWQFKGWKWSNPVELFHNVLGFHLMRDDREADPKILSWNCKVLKVRHLSLSLSPLIISPHRLSSCVVDQLFKASFGCKCL
jgi:hypothetical protein